MRPGEVRKLEKEVMRLRAAVAEQADSSSAAEEATAEIEALQAANSTLAKALSDCEDKCKS